MDDNKPLGQLRSTFLFNYYLSWWSLHVQITGYKFKTIFRDVSNKPIVKNAQVTPLIPKAN